MFVPPGFLSSVSRWREKPLSRRAVLAALGAAILTVAGLLFRGIRSFLAYRGPASPSRYVIPLPERYPFKGQGFWVDRDEKGLFAFSALCPHLGCRPRYLPEREEYVCPCHGSRFARGGRYLSGPAGRDMQRVWIGRAPKGRLLVDLSRLAAESYRLRI